MEQLIESLEDANEAAQLNKISRADFLSDVPTYLRYKVTENIFNGVATKVLIFENRDPDFVSHMVPKMVSLKVKRNEYVYKKGQFSSAIYLLFSGRVGEMDDQVCIREYAMGSCFGQIEILLNLPRLSSIKATEDTHLMLIERSDINNAMKVFPELKIDLSISAIIKLMRTKQTLHKVGAISLHRSEDFARLSETKTSGLENIMNSTRLSLRRFKAFTISIKRNTKLISNCATNSKAGSNPVLIVRKTEFWTLSRFYKMETATITSGKKVWGFRWRGRLTSASASTMHHISGPSRANKPGKLGSSK